MKDQKGITLVALVITIIVLLILAAVSIAALSGQNGILTKCSDSEIPSITERSGLNGKTADRYALVTVKSSYGACGTNIQTQPRRHEQV